MPGIRRPTFNLRNSTRSCSCPGARFLCTGKFSRSTPSTAKRLTACSNSKPSSRTVAKNRSNLSHGYSAASPDRNNEALRRFFLVWFFHLDFENDGQDERALGGLFVEVALQV